MSSKLDRRIKYTQLALKESLMKVMQEKPLTKITIKEVCELADINRSTFYSHYTDLYDLLNQIENTIIEDMNKTLSLYNYTKNEEAIEMTEKLLEYIVQNRESCQMLFSEYGNPNFQKKVMMVAHKHLLKSLIADNKDFPFNPEYLSMFIANGSIHIVQHWLKNGLKESPKEMAKLMITLATEGLSPFQQ
ncbi:TetR/AcrR family transcriptional regulator [Alkalihalobacterium elongatum]|uniref:TetR/AcrR family transcriptional regulator n=1 Tax=Alkalihalobacterium elongatum TaxID=2675466 RepID=UPI001C1F79D8|nr:TetR-like C-terminal domain-containing protein [Alkalihalobacterium elongatum]